MDQLPPHSRLKVQHLLTLASVGKNRNAHSAGRELGLSQPAVSKIIREVEEIFGLKLFDRGRGGMHPNSVGQVLIDRAVALLNDLAHTREEVEAIAAGALGHLRLGVIAFVSPALISGTLRRFAEGSVSLRLEISEGSTRRLVDQLLRCELDCVIGRYDSSRERELRQEVLYYQRFVAVAARGHPLLRNLRDGDGIVAVRDHGWIAPPSGTAAREALSTAFMRADLDAPRVEIETSSVEVVKAALADTRLVGILPAEIAHAAADAIQVLPLALDHRPAPLTLIRRRDQTTTPPVERFSRALIEVALALKHTDRAQPPGGEPALLPVAEGS